MPVVCLPWSDPFQDQICWPEMYQEHVPAPLAYIRKECAVILELCFLLDISFLMFPFIVNRLLLFIVYLNGIVHNSV